MTSAAPVQVGHPSEWRGSDFGSLSSLAFVLQQRHIEALELAYQQCLEAGVTVDSLRTGDFGLPSMSGELDALFGEVQDGRGFVVIEGFPVTEWPLDKLELVYLGLMSNFGRPEIQSSLGERLGRVRNVGGKDTRERGYRNSVGLTLHTDLSHGLLGMLSVRVARSGGESVYSSAITVHNIMCAERPDLVSNLYRGFHFHRLDSARPGEAPVTGERIPTFSVAQGVLSCRYARTLIDSAIEEQGEEHTPQVVEALDLFDDVASRGEIALERIVEPGQLIIANDYATLHSRRAFHDHPEPDRGRLFLRTWIAAEPPRPRVAAVDAIPTFEWRADGSTYYRGRSARIGG